MTNPIPPCEQSVLFPIVGESMLEYGNKQTAGISYKSWLTENYGIRHVSVDWNGKDGALPLDLRKPLDLGLFDMCTNFGTTEHISEQYQPWKSLHDHCAVDGVVVCATPIPGDWCWHGNHYPTEEFYIQFAERNGYEVEILKVGQEAPRRCFYVRMLKVESMEFTMPEGITMYFNTIRPRGARDT